MFDNIIIFGDLHQSWIDIISFSKKFDIKNSAFIGVGDFGVGFEKDEFHEIKRLNYFNNSFIANNNHIFTCRGNHDNPIYFKEHKKIGNIEFMPDYSTLTLNGINFLFIGGAISVDRKANPNFKNSSGRNYHQGRVAGVDYWPDEAVVFDKEKINNLPLNIDVVVSHTAPDFCNPQQYSGLDVWLEYDNNLMNDIIEERQTMTSIYNMLKIHNHNLKFWYYGHFHHNYKEVIDDTTFVLVDKNNFIEHNYTPYV